MTPTTIHLTICKFDTMLWFIDIATLCLPGLEEWTWSGHPLAAAAGPSKPWVHGSEWAFVPWPVAHPGGGPHPAPGWQQRWCCPTWSDSGAVSPPAGTETWLSPDGSSPAENREFECFSRRTTRRIPYYKNGDFKSSIECGVTQICHSKSVHWMAATCWLHRVCKVFRKKK